MNKSFAARWPQWPNMHEARFFWLNPNTTGYNDHCAWTSFTQWIKPCLGHIPSRTWGLTRPIKNLGPINRLAYLALEAQQPNRRVEVEAGGYIVPRHSRSPSSEPISPFCSCRSAFSMLSISQVSRSHLSSCHLAHLHSRILQPLYSHYTKNIHFLRFFNFLQLL